jgi:signal peptidase II
MAGSAWASRRATRALAATDPESAAASSAGTPADDEVVEDGEGLGPLAAVEVGAPRSPRFRARILALVPIVAAGVFVIDRVAKLLVVANLQPGVPQRILGPLLTFDYVQNPGAAFSLASGSTWVFTLIAVVVVLAIAWFWRRIASGRWAVFFGLLLGGTIGNLFDRLTRPPGFGVGHVVDFLEIPILPAIFNLADVAIVSSMCLFVLLTLAGIGLDGRRRVEPSRSGAAPGRDDASGPGA